MYTEVERMRTIEEQRRKQELERRKREKTAALVAFGLTASFLAGVLAAKAGMGRMSRI